jgi:HD-like signal output (HDOD) protein
MRLLVWLAFILAIALLLRSLLRKRGAPPTRLEARVDTSAPDGDALTRAPAALPAPFDASAAIRSRAGPMPAGAAGARSAADSRRALHALLLGVEALADEVPLAHARIVNEVLGSLEDAAEEPRWMPRRPLLIPELMRLATDPDASRRQISALVARDPSLTAELLRIANSAYYRTGPQPVESIDRAVAVLGTDGMRSAIAAAVLQPVFATPAGAFARFPSLTWDHAFITAVAAESCAAIVEDEDPFAAQLLALLTGLGRIVVFRAASERYAAEPDSAPSPSAIGRLLELQAPAVARRIAASWQVSQRMLDALSDQIVATRSPAAPLSALGRAVVLGERIGTLVLLHRERRIDAGAARDAGLAQGATAAFFDRLWLRLTAT